MLQYIKSKINNKLVVVYSLIYMILMYCLAMNGYEKNLCRNAVCKVLRIK